MVPFGTDETICRIVREYSPMLLDGPQQIAVLRRSGRGGRRLQRDISFLRPAADAAGAVKGCADQPLCCMSKKWQRHFFEKGFASLCASVVRLCQPRLLVSGVPERDGSGQQLQKRLRHRVLRVGGGIRAGTGCGSC
mgnify:CR=1 FL=1